MKVMALTFQHGFGWEREDNAQLLIHSSQKANKQASEGGRSQRQPLGTRTRAFNSFLN